MKVLFLVNSSPEEVKNKLERNLGPVKFKFLGGYKGRKQFIGSISESSFNIRLGAKYKNSFAPIFYGAFYEDGENTKVLGSFFIHPFVFTLLLFL